MDYSTDAEGRVEVSAKATNNRVELTILVSQSTNGYLLSGVAMHSIYSFISA
jgi:hypothetical protein